MRTLSRLLPIALALLAGCAQPDPLRVLWPPPPNKPYLEWIGTYANKGDFPKTSAGKMLESVVGEGEPSPFKTPFGIAADGAGKVYVSDIHVKNLVVFDFNAKTIDLFSQNPVFDLPLGVAVDRAGRVYVADGLKKTVMVFAPDRQPLFSCGGPEIFEKPAYLALNERLGRLYVTDSMAGQVEVFDLAGNHLFTFGRKGNIEGALYGPQGLAIDRENRVFVADTFNARIQVFDAEGKYLYQFGARGDQPGQFEYPKDLAFDSDGNLYLIDSRRPNVQTFSPDGKLLLITGSGERSSHKLGYVLPTSVYLDGNDRIYIADGLNRRFTVWQYLSAAYLQEHPVTDRDRQAFERFRREQEEAEKKKEKKTEEK